MISDKETFVNYNIQKMEFFVNLTNIIAVLQVIKKQLQLLFHIWKDVLSETMSREITYKKRKLLDR